MHDLTLLAGFLVALAYFLPDIVRSARAFYHKRTMANKVPGPKGIPLFGNMLQIAKMDKEAFTKFWLSQADYFRNQGESLMRINILGMSNCIPLDGQTAKYILESHDELRKGTVYDFLRAWLGEGLLISIGQKWHTRRKMLTPTFHFQQLNEYVHTFNAESRKFTEILSEFDGKEVDLFEYIKRCALDIICETAMGRSVGAQYNHDHKYVAAVRDYLYLAREYILKPQTRLPVYWHLSGRAAMYKESLKILLDFSTSIIRDRQRQRKEGIKNDEKKTNFLDLLLEMNENGVLSEEDIRSEVDTFMFEGHDTSSSAVAWAIWSLAHNTGVQEKVREEIVGVVGDNDDDLTVEHLKEMVYLDAVVKEVFRLYPPVPIINRRLHNDLPFGKFTVPAGAIVTISPLILHRNKKAWGEDADEFKPERFIEEDPTRRHPFDYIPFSAGLRNCIGQRFGQYETKIMLAFLIRRFRFLPSSSVTFEENLIGMEAILRPKYGIPVKIVKI